MPVVAEATLTGSSNVADVWGESLARARGQVDQFGQAANKSLQNNVGGGSDSALKSVNSLYTGMQALASSAIITGAIRVGNELLTIGGKADVASNALTAMSHGDLDGYLNKVSAAADGTISNMDIMTSSNRALRLGVVDSADEMAQLTNAARILGKTMGEDTSQAMDDLTTGIGRGSRMILDNLGIIMKQSEIQDEVNKVMAENPGLTANAAQKQALFNIAIAQANQLQQEGVGVTNTMADEQQRFAAEIDNAQQSMGQWLTHGLLPVIEGSRKIGEANRDFSRQMLLNTHSMAEYNATMVDMFHRTGQVVDNSLLFGFEQQQQWEAARQSALAAITPIQTMSTAAVEGGRAERDAIAAATQAQKEHVSTLQEVDDAGKAAAAAIDAYNQVLQQQSALQLNTEQQVKDLTGLWWGAGTATKGTADEIAGLNEQLDKLTAKGGDTADVMSQLADAQTEVAFGAGADWGAIFEFGAAQMQQMGLSADQLLTKYNELGLATGQVTELQIAQGTALRELDNLYASNSISTQTYLEALSQIPAAADASTASLIAQSAAARDAAGGAIEAATEMAKAQGASQEAINQIASQAAQNSLSSTDALANASKAAQDALTNFQGVLDSSPAELKMNLNVEAAQMNLNAMLTAIDTAQGTLPVDSDTTQAIAIAQAAVARISSMVATITITSVDQTGNNDKEKAFGGPAPVGGGLTLVGEHGPEMVYLPPGAFVATAPATSALMSGMSGGASVPTGGVGGGNTLTVNLYAYGVNDPVQLTDMIEREIRARGQAFAELK